MLGLLDNTFIRKINEFNQLDGNLELFYSLLLLSTIVFTNMPPWRSSLKRLLAIPWLHALIQGTTRYPKLKLEFI